MMEAQILLAIIVQRYRLELVPGAKIATDPVISLRPKYGMPMSLVPRAARGRKDVDEEVQAAQ